MKTIIYLISLIVIVTATPIANKRNVDIYWPAIDKFPETINRLKKSPGHEVPQLSGDKINGIQNELFQNGPGLSLPEGNFRKPITIRSSSVKDPQEQLAVTSSAEKCKQVRFNVCEGENEENSKITSRQADKLVSGKNMEDSIKFAKEAMDSLKDDIHKIEQTSHNHADSDDNLHTKLEVARQALDHIHQSFGNLEAQDSGVDKSKDTVGVTEDDKKLAMWREMVENTRKAGGVFRHEESDNNEQNKFQTKNTDDISLNGDHDLEPTDKQKFDNEFALINRNTQQDEVKSNLKVESVSDLKPTKLNDESNDGTRKINPMNKELTGTTLEKLTKDSGDGEANKNQNNEANLNHGASKDTPKFQLSPAEKQAWMESHSKSEVTKREKETMHVEETKHEDERSQTTERLNNRSSQDKSIDMLKPDSNNGLPKLDLASAETDKKMPKSMKSNDEFSNIRLSQVNIKEPELFTISDDKQHIGKMEKLTPLHDRQVHQPMGLVKAAEFNLNQNSPNQEFEMIQNSNQNVEFGLPEHPTFEDMEFMKWAKMANSEKQSGHIPPQFQTASNFKNEHLKASALDEHLHHMHSIHHDSSSQEEHVPFESNMHNHMHSMLQMKSPQMDSAMQPSMAMGMRDAYGRSAMEYNTMQWNQPGLVRTAYGPSGGSASSSSSSTSSGGSSGAVGVFPNANVGGCAIPLLLSCSPSLISGSLAKSASSSSSSQSSGYGAPPPPPPSYRNGDELAYFIKRDTKLNEEMPIVKVLRTNTPFNHKHELILDRNLS